MDLGGTEGVVLTLAQELVALGHRVTVAAAPGRLVSRVEDAGAAFLPLPDVASHPALSLPRVTARLAAFARGNAVTVLHSHHRGTALACRPVARLVGLPHVHTQHNAFTDRRRLTSRTLRPILVEAVSRRVRANLLDLYGLDPRRVGVIYNGVPRYVGSSPGGGPAVWPEPRPRFVVSAVGRLTEGKGFDVLLTAFASVAGSDVGLLIVGDGELRGELGGLAEGLGVSDRVRWAGFRTDVQSIMAASDLVVFPSSRQDEGFPLVPVEAFSVGAPLVSSDVPGAVEAVADGRNALVFPADDAGALASRMAQALSDPALRDRLGREGRADYERLYSPEVFAGHYVDAYRAARAPR
jgi:glycosyltransferase involved in cell wall biosynthesis